MPMATYYNIVTTKELYIEIIPKKLIKFDSSLIYITLKKRLFRVKEGRNVIVMQTGSQVPCISEGRAPDYRFKHPQSNPCLSLLLWYSQ